MAIPTMKQIYRNTPAATLRDWLDAIQAVLKQRSSGRSPLASVANGRGTKCSREARMEYQERSTCDLMESQRVFMELLGLEPPPIERSPEAKGYKRGLKGVSFATIAVTERHIRSGIRREFPPIWLAVESAVPRRVNAYIEVHPKRMFLCQRDYEGQYWLDLPPVAIKEMDKFYSLKELAPFSFQLDVSGLEPFFKNVTSQSKPRLGRAKTRRSAVTA